MATLVRKLLRVLYQIADHCGNLATATHLITIDDNVNPTLIAPASLTAVLVCAIEQVSAEQPVDEVITSGSCAYQIADHCGTCAICSYYH